MHRRECIGFYLFFLTIDIYISFLITVTKHPTERQLRGGGAHFGSQFRGMGCGKAWEAQLGLWSGPASRGRRTPGLRLSLIHPELGAEKLESSMLGVGLWK